MAANTGIEWEADPRVFIFNSEVPGKTRMHVRSLELDDWVKIDETYPAQMVLRRHFLETRRDDVLVSNTDESAVACQWELFDMLAEYLPKRFPNIFDASTPGQIYNKVLDEYVSTQRDDPEDPLVRCNRMTQEDWSILEWNEAEEGYVLTSGIVCFPSFWSLREKFNKSMAQIHVPVKTFMKHLKPRVYDLFARMKPENPWWRANWTICNDVDGPLDLYSVPSAEGVNVTTPYDENTGRALVYREEYQTLRKLPKTKCIVFSIRTYQRYLEDFHNIPDSDCLGLIRAIQSKDEDDREYKRVTYWGDAAVKYLHNIVESRKPESFVQRYGKYVAMGGALTCGAAGVLLATHRNTLV